MCSRFLRFGFVDGGRIAVGHEFAATDYAVGFTYHPDNNVAAAA
jgi:hypothetical protein